MWRVWSILFSSTFNNFMQRKEIFWPIKIAKANRAEHSERRNVDSDKRGARENKFNLLVKTAITPTRHTGGEMERGGGDWTFARSGFADGMSAALVPRIWHRIFIFGNLISSRRSERISLTERRKSKDQQEKMKRRGREEGEEGESHPSRAKREESRGRRSAMSPGCTSNPFSAVFYSLTRGWKRITVIKAARDEESRETRKGRDGEKGGKVDRCRRHNQGTNERTNERREGGWNGSKPAKPPAFDASHYGNATSRGSWKLCWCYAGHPFFVQPTRPSLPRPPRLCSTLPSLCRGSDPPPPPCSSFLSFSWFQLKTVLGLSRIHKIQLSFSSLLSAARRILTSQERERERERERVYSTS